MHEFENGRDFSKNAVDTANSISQTLFDMKWGVGKLQNPFDFSTIIHILRPGFFVRMVGRSTGSKQCGYGSIITLHCIKSLYKRRKSLS